MIQYFRETCDAGTKKENDLRAIYLWNKIERALGKKENELSSIHQNYSVNDGLIIVSHIKH